MVLATELNPVFALVTGILMPEVVVLGLYCLGGWIFPGLASLVGRPFAGRDVSARLARDHVRTAVRTPVALAAPILAISAIAGSMMVALSFAADWVTALDREQLATPYVVETGGDARVGDRLAGLPLADPRITVTMKVAADNDDQDVDVVDPTTAPEARGMRVVKGDLADLDHGVAITSSFAFDSGVHLGDRAAGSSGGRGRARRARPLRRRDRAASLVPAKYRDTVPELYFVDPGSADLDEARRRHGRPGAHRRRLDRRGRPADPGRQQPRPVGAARPGGAVRRDRDRQLGPGRRLAAPGPAPHRRPARRHP